MPKVNSPQSQSLNPLANSFYPASSHVQPAPGNRTALKATYDAAQNCLSRHLIPHVKVENLPELKMLSVYHTDMSDEVMNSVWALRNVVNQILEPLERRILRLYRTTWKNLVAWEEQVQNSVTDLLKSLSPEETDVLMELISGRFCHPTLLLGYISENNPGIMCLLSRAKRSAPLEKQLGEAPPVLPANTLSEPARHNDLKRTVENPPTPKVRLSPIKENPKEESIAEQLSAETRLIEQAIQDNQTSGHDTTEREDLRVIDQCLDLFINKLGPQKKTNELRLVRIQSVLEHLSVSELFNLVSSIETWGFHRATGRDIPGVKPRSEKHKNCFNLAMMALADWPGFPKAEASTGQIIKVLNAMSQKGTTQTPEAIAAKEVYVRRAVLSADYYSSLVAASIMRGKHHMSNESRNVRATYGFASIFGNGNANFVSKMKGLGETPLIGEVLKKIYTDLLDTVGKKINPEGAFDLEANGWFTLTDSQPIQAMANSCYRHRIAPLGEALLKQRYEILDHLVRIASVAGLRQHGNLVDAQQSVVSLLGLRRSPSNAVLFHMTSEIVDQIQAIPDAPEPNHTKDNNTATSAKIET